MDDPFFKTSGPLISDEAIRWCCGTLIVLALIAGLTVVGVHHPETALSLAGGIACIGFVAFMIWSGFD